MPRPCNQLSSAPLSWLWDSPNLSHQSHVVAVVPRFADLPLGDAAEGHARWLYGVASRSDAHQVPLVGAPGSPTCRHRVPFCYLLFNGGGYIGEGVAVHAGKLFDGLGPAYRFRV